MSLVLSFKYPETESVARVLGMFPEHPNRTITHFLNNPKTTWENMEHVIKLFKTADTNILAFLERIEHSPFLLALFTDNKDITTFYRGRICAMGAIGMMRDIYWRLSGNGNIEGVELAKVVLRLWKHCSEPLALDVFTQRIESCFSTANGLSDFSNALDYAILPKGGGFKGRARYQAVENAVEVLRNTDPITPSRKIAIRLMGSAVQSQWCNPQMTQGEFVQLLNDVEKILEIVRTLPAENSKMRSILLTQFNQRFFFQKK